MVFLLVVDERTLCDDKPEPANLNDWAQDWLNCDGYDRARQQADSKHWEAVS